MKYSKMNEYIYHYLKEDKTKSAIMLTGGWGTGKSHYINNDLAEYFRKRKQQCLVISLYGMKNIEEINKSIFWGLFTLKYNTKDKVKKAGAVAVKTIIRNLTNHFDIELPTAEKDLNDLYECVDLKSKLIVLEDVERTEIDLFQLLGYVNNLVEHDGAKVLLVANEDEIIEMKLVDNQGTGSVEIPKAQKNTNPEKMTCYEYTEKTKKYLVQKEKTVSDTIIFEGDVGNAICDIIHSFGNDKLLRFCCTEEVKNIKDTMILIGNNNLRAFMFACQKTVDIYKAIKFEVIDDFLACVFYGILAYSLRIKKGSGCEWDESHDFSYGLGIGQYPLPRFCYDYICQQKLDADDIKEAQEKFAKLRLYDKRKSQNDKDIQILSNYYLEHEADVKSAVQSISKKLENVETISFYDYGRIAAYLIVVKNILGIDIEKAKKLLIENLNGRGNEIEADALFTVTLKNEEPHIQEEYDNIRKAMYKALKVDGFIPDFVYNPKQSMMFSEYVSKNEMLFHSKEKFAALLDVEKLIKMFSESSPKEMNDIRQAFWAVYRMDNLRSFFKTDKPYLEKLKEGIEAYLESGAGDKIQKMQAKWFCQNLEEFIKKMS